MARADAIGMFWEDLPVVKPPKVEKVKRTPPEPVWLKPDYLPGLEEASIMELDLFTDEELVQAARDGERLVWDIESYPNYFLVAFRSIQSGKVVYFEDCPEIGVRLEAAKLFWVLSSFILIDYNGHNYDVPIASIAVTGRTSHDMFSATDQIINLGERTQDVLKRYKVKRLSIDHIDLIELVALSPSLKLLAGRLHSPRMQDLPFLPGTVLSEKQILITRWYCVNDLTNTELLYRELLPDIQLREKMSARYGVDLRSHSDAQIAEAVISSEIKKMTRQRYLTRPVIPPGTIYYYKPPAFLKYQTALMQWVLGQVCAAQFTVHANGSLVMPKELEALKITIADGIYRMGIGGLHSSEKTITHLADENTILCDRDVASYYPRIILNCELAPAHLGRMFLMVYNSLVEERLKAKSTKDKVAADGLKIVVNGSFGKLGNKYSTLYSPDLLAQVTVTGQLSLLMLIERIALAGIPVISANTDGIVIKCPKVREEDMDAIVKQWEYDTGFETEATYYSGLYSRDVNNYFAVKKGGGDAKGRFLDEQLGVKVKGVYAERGSSRNSILSKNPMTQICSDAILHYLTTGRPVVDTIRACQDIRRFCSVRTVRGGAVKNGEYLGKAIRWYYAAGEEGEIVYAISGNKVPRSEGAKPLMQLPEAFPGDVDYEWYEREASKILVEIGLIQAEIPEDENDEEVDDDSKKELT